MSEKKWCVYKHTNKMNGKVYIGITSREPEVRWANGNGYWSNKHFYNAIKKYGWENFDHEILCESLSESEAKERETHFISIYGAFGENGYNQTEGGEGCRGWKMNDEQKKKISVALTGRKRPPEIGEMVRRRSLGKKASPEARRRMSEAQKGRHHTEETKALLSEIMKKKGIPEAAVRAAAEMHKRPVVQCTMDGDFVRVWPSAMDAERECGFHHNCIAKCARGKAKHHGGFKWAYAEEVAV